jgi:3-oxoacyl-[acyl-carrier protein] reductase
MDSFDLSGRVAVVTGAGGGLGAASAAALASAGASVICLDIDGAAAGATAAAIGEAGGTAEARAVDVSRSAELDEVASDAVARLGRLDVWVNVAGVMRPSPVVDLTESDLDALFAVNLKGVLFGSQAAARRMVPQGSGAIVNVASAIIDAPQPQMAAYGMSKAAVSHLSRTLALEVGRAGVRVNVVAPGWTRTGMTTGSLLAADGTVDEDAVAKTEQMQARFTPLRRAADPHDTAAAVVYLASDSAAFVTGQTLRPHGGVTMPW